MDSASITPSGVIPAGSPLGFGNASHVESSANVWTVSVRMHKDFLP
jgi:hypothetical protein